MFNYRHILKKMTLGLDKNEALVAFMSPSFMSNLENKALGTVRGGVLLAVPHRLVRDRQQ